MAAVDEMWALPFMVNAFRAGTLVAVLAALLGWSLLFGSFLGITALQVEVLAVVTLVVLLALAAIGRPLLFATVDPGIAAARGVGVRGLDLAFLALTALVVAATVQITGALLVFTLLVLPAATAQRVTARPAAAIGASCALGLVTVWVALTVAFYTPYPFGFWLAAVAFGLYLAAHLAPVPTQRAERRSPGVGPAARATVAEGVEEA